MKYCLLTFAIFLSCLGAKAQTQPNATLAMEIKWIAAKIGSPVPDAVHFLYGFQKMDAPDATHEQYVSVANNIVINFGKDDAGNITSIDCGMYIQALSTIKKAIENMGLTLSDEAGPDGFTVYKGPYKGFLSVGEKTIRFIITAKEIIAGE